MSRSYDPARGWLTNANANSGYGLNLTYAYNAIGQATGVTDSVNGGQSVTTYSYDNLNRLSGAIANNWTMAWTYDAFGNRLTQTGTAATGQPPVPNVSLTYNASTNQIATWGYSFDANGNMTQMPGPSSSIDYMSYDTFDRLSGLQNSNNQSGSSYSYDAFGRRIARLLPSGSVKVYFYSMRGQLLGEYDFTPSGTTGIYPVSLSMPNVYFAGQRVNQWTDRTGSKRKDNTNTNSHYYPYGEEITGTANDTFKFAQTYRDSDSGLDYAEQRYYTSGIGRFLTVDPHETSPHTDNPQSWNRYSYGWNDPVNQTDPSGMDPEGSPGTTCYIGGTWWPSGYCDFALIDAALYANLPASSAPQTLVVKGLTKKGQKYDRVKQTFSEIQDSIDPDCLSFLQSGGGNLNGYVSDLLSNDLLAVGNFTSNLAAFTGTGGTNLAPGDAAIVVNGVGAFFSSAFTVGPGKIQGGTDQADVFILLHELGHALDAAGFKSDFNNSAAGKSNDALIQANCQKTLDKFK
jgi:RHS repeat-associated protein